MSYELIIKVYNNGCEIKDNQNKKYYYKGFDETGRTDNINDLVRWLQDDLPDRELPKKRGKK